MTDQLDTQLAELTRYKGENTELWKQAQAAAPRRHRFWAHPLVAACLVLAGGVILVAILLPSLGKARVGRSLHTIGQLRGYAQEQEAHRATPDAKAEDLARVLAATPFPSQVPATDAFVLAGLPDNQVIVKGGAAAPAPDRFVVRKATIDLISDDVRATFAKAAHLVSDAQSEYVENSSVSGTGKETQATLTLRISADRLSAVLTALRDLGTVKSENTTGEDVTGQVVDLEARIRNEQKIEQELLQLLDKRTDAPLKDILELRSSLSGVRESIERLIGQRDRLSRLVSLASILVTIRPPDQPPKAPEEPKPSITSYFTKNVAASWRTGLEYLADTLSGAVALLIGGLVWWLLLAVVVMAALRYRTHAIMRGA